MIDEKATGDNEKPRILAWGDYCCSTGFGTVMSNVMREVAKTDRYEIDVLGINYTGDPYDKEKWPGNVYPAMPGMMAQNGLYADVYGRQRLLDMVGKGIYDVLYLLQDTFIVIDILPHLKQAQAELAASGQKTFKIVYYFPIDATPKEEWARDVVAQVDFPVAYTKYGREEVAKFVPTLANIPYIYHGTNIDDFHPIDNKKELAEFKKEYFNTLADGKFLLMNVNRNQPRKDIARSLMTLAELKRRGRKVFMYLHMQHSDVGGNIHVIADQLGLVNEEDFVLPHPRMFSANQGLPIERLNKLYNVADAIFTSTLGEGWGLSITEAFATKTPIIGPANTSLNEIMADNRGILVPSGSDPSLWFMGIQDLERIRPLMDVEAAADAVEALMDGKKVPDVEAAYEWVTNNTWSDVCKYWLQIIDGAAQAARAQKKTDDNGGLNRAERRALERKAKKAKK